MKGHKSVAKGFPPCSQVTPMDTNNPSAGAQGGPVDDGLIAGGSMEEGGTWTNSWLFICLKIWTVLYLWILLRDFPLSVKSDKIDISGFRLDRGQ